MELVELASYSHVDVEAYTSCDDEGLLPTVFGTDMCVIMQNKSYTLI